MSSASARATKAIDPLSKRIPQNPKYKDVQHVVDTGASISKYMKKIEEIRANYRYQPNELFKRMKLSTFVQLVIQVSAVDDVIIEDDSLSSRPYTSDSDRHMLSERSGGGSPPPFSQTAEAADAITTPAPETSRSTLQGLVTGVGEFELTHPGTAASDSGVANGSSNGLAIECPYLLLDVRDKDEYEQCRIITAHHFPIALLSRSCNYETKEMLSYKNQTGKIILIYDEDERIAPKAASTLVERGYDNLFMLSGGLKVAVKLFPNGLLTGTPPASIAASKPKEIINASKQAFDAEDIANLSAQMDLVMQDKSVGSRLSRASTRASQKGASASTDTGRGLGTARSTASSLSTSSSVSGRPAFKP